MLMQFTGNMDHLVFSPRLVRCGPELFDHRRNTDFAALVATTCVASVFTGCIAWVAAWEFASHTLRGLGILMIYVGSAHFLLALPAMILNCKIRRKYDSRRGARSP